MRPDAARRARGRCRCTLVTPLLLLVAIASCLLLGRPCDVSLLYDTTIGGVRRDASRRTSRRPSCSPRSSRPRSSALIIAIVCCYKGMNAKGGPQGVGRAVNQAVVIAFAALWVVNYAITSITLALFPSSWDCADAAIAAGLREIGELARFSWRAIAALRGVWHYLGEALRQAGILVAGSAPGRRRPDVRDRRASAACSRATSRRPSAPAARSGCSRCCATCARRSR